MKTILILIITLLSSLSFSATRMRFFVGDRNAIVFITPTDVYGNTDSDSTDLYQIMNVPEQDTMLGKGKGIVSADSDFNLVCGEYRQQCQVIINKSPNTIISASKKYMSFTATGDEAERLTNMFKLNDRGEAYFQTIDKLFRFSGNSKNFTFEASENF
ncbi:hypothetical protein K2P97_09210 [bacterium]|nr:hypothetical protein [bacterium]